MNRPGAAGGERGRRIVGPVVALGVLAVLFAALGQWQVRRLAWKEALIAHVEAGLGAAPAPLDAIPGGGLGPWEYRRIALSGRYDPRGAVLVTGTSTLGSGYWAMAPLAMADGRTVYVNRGFVPLGSRPDAVRAALPAGTVAVVGLLRLNEPGGTALRANRPAEARWYSRDVAAIAGHHAIHAERRFFIDAQAETPHRPGGPVPGLTVIAFPNSHLAYALTWFALAVLSAGGATVLWRRRP